MSDNRARVTIHDVARDSGLSISSVSRALSGGRPVSAPVARRAEDSAARLGYRVNAVGRSLRTQRTRSIGLVVADITNPFFPALVQAVAHEARTHGYSLLIADAQNDVAAERDCVQTLLDSRVDALLISPTHRELSRATVALAARAVPTIQLDRVIDDQVGFVRTDQAQGIDAIIAHLRSTGRSRLAYVGPDPSVSTSWERERAFAAAMAGGRRSAVRVLHCDFTVESGRAAAVKLRRRWPETDAVVCANDLIAFGVMQELTGIGVDLRPVAISGFDDTVIADAAHLTSVRQPVAEMAEAAVRLCVEATDSPTRLAQLTFSPTLIVRDSTD